MYGDRHLSLSVGDNTPVVLQNDSISSCVIKCLSAMSQKLFTLSLLSIFYCAGCFSHLFVL